MNTFGRRLFNGVAGISVAICLVSLVLGIRSYLLQDTFILVSHRRWEFNSNLGIFEFSVLTQYPAKVGSSTATWVPIGPAQPVSTKLAFHHHSSSPQSFVRPFWYRIFKGREGQYVSQGLGPPNKISVSVGLERIGPLFGVPAWVVILLTAVLPGVWVIGARKRALVKKRAIQFCCVHCGYDLRATPDRCPECGKTVGSR